MRKEIQPKIRVGYSAISITFFLLLVLSISSISQVSGVPGDQLLIEITKDGAAIDEIYEEESFVVSVLDPNPVGSTPYQKDVFITFNGENYHITAENEEAEISIRAPAVYDDTEYPVNASKQGYVANEIVLTVLNRELLKLAIIPEKWTVEVNERFSVVVTDESGVPIENVAVAIGEMNAETKYTNSDGRVWLTAPEKAGDIEIFAQKDGYLNEEESIAVNYNPQWWEQIINNKYFPIIIAIICLICAIAIVNFRSRKSVYNRAKEISNERMLKKYDSQVQTTSQTDSKEEKIELNSFSGKPVRSQSDANSKVEEIRISRPKIKKEIVKVETEEDKANKVVSEKRIKRKDYDWFEGTDDMRYEIDKLTGKVDEEGLDKWFEGVGDLKDKIDEKVKKKDKKKNEEKEE